MNSASDVIKKEQNKKKEMEDNGVICYPVKAVFKIN